jgi:hypothetical protein
LCYAIEGVNTQEKVLGNNTNPRRRMLTRASINQSPRRLAPGGHAKVTVRGSCWSINHAALLSSTCTWNVLDMSEDSADLLSSPTSLHHAFPFPSSYQTRPSRRLSNDSTLSINSIGGALDTHPARPPNSLREAGHNGALTRHPTFSLRINPLNLLQPSRPSSSPPSSAPAS